LSLSLRTFVRRHRGCLHADDVDQPTCCSCTYKQCERCGGSHYPAGKPFDGRRDSRARTCAPRIGTAGGFGFPMAPVHALCEAEMPITGGTMNGVTRLEFVAAAARDVSITSTTSTTSTASTTFATSTTSHCWILRHELLCDMLLYSCCCCCYCCCCCCCC
jgi:hypothetical protein